MHAELMQALSIHHQTLGFIRYLRPIYIPGWWTVSRWQQVRQMLRRRDRYTDMVKDPEIRWNEIIWWGINADRWLSMRGVRFDQELTAIRYRARELLCESDGQITSYEAIRLAWLEWYFYYRSIFPDPPVGWVRVGNEYIFTREHRVEPHPSGEAG